MDQETRERLLGRSMFFVSFHFISLLTLFLKKVQLRTTYDDGAITAEEMFLGFRSMFSFFFPFLLTKAF
jgi:hypothetical protein